MTLKLTKIEDEAKFVVVHSTTQPDEYQPLEKRTQDLLPIRYIRLAAVLSVYLVRPSILQGFVLLAKSSTSKPTLPQTGFTYLVSKGARRLILLETLVLKVSAVTLLMSKSREITF